MGGMNDRAVMRQALEALEHYAQFGATVRARGAIEALRAALMEPVVVQEQEELVTRRSASAALDYLSLHNGPGRLAEATKMLVHSPRREWRGLTDADFDLICDNHSTLQGAARAIEQALKGKNYE
jgi:hypothetical protein